MQVPKAIHIVKSDIPIEKVWSFVSDMNHWAPLVRGYLDHSILNDRQSTWEFKGNVGIVQKTIRLKIDITEWLEPTKVVFNLTGLNENFTGNGYFVARSLGGRQTEITGFLEITANGLMGPMINSVLKSFIPKTTKELTEAIVHKIIEIETVTT